MSREGASECTTIATLMSCSNAFAWVISRHGSNFLIASASGSAARLDPRLALHLDPSDVVQEALAEAASGSSRRGRWWPRRVPAAAALAVLPVAPKFRRDRLIELQRFHLNARRRSVTRERLLELPLPDQSAVILEHPLAVAGRGTPREGPRNTVRPVAARPGGARPSIPRRPADRRDGLDGNREIIAKGYGFAYVK